MDNDKNRNDEQQVDPHDLKHTDNDDTNEVSMPIDVQQIGRQTCNQQCEEGGNEIGQCRGCESLHVERSLP